MLVIFAQLAVVASAELEPHPLSLCPAWVQDLTRCLPEPGKSGPNPTANPTEHLAKLKLIVRDLAALSKCSFSQKVPPTNLSLTRAASSVTQCTRDSMRSY